MAKQYSQAEVDALLARASGADPTTRAYRVIKTADGAVAAYPPTGTPNAVAGHNGPWTIGDQHPDDWYGVGDDGLATKNIGEGSSSKGGPSGALPDDFPARSALADAGLTTYAKVRNYGDLTDLPGIGAATEAKIQERLTNDAKGASNA